MCFSSSRLAGLVVFVIISSGLQRFARGEESSVENRKTFTLKSTKRTLQVDDFQMIGKMHGPASGRSAASWKRPER